MKILITGGVKSGKSTFAEQKTLELSEGFTPLYLATAECLDEEMQTKIVEHRRKRMDRFRILIYSLYPKIITSF